MTDNNEMVIEGLFLCLADSFSSFEYMLQQLYDDLATIRVEAAYLKQLSAGNTIDTAAQQNYIERCIRERARVVKGA